MPHTTADFATAKAANPALPQPLDCESCITLGFFLSPILETSDSWADLLGRLAAKGYDLRLVGDHLVLMDVDADRFVCTTEALGVSLRDLAARIGAPRVCGESHVIRA